MYILSVIIPVYNTEAYIQKCVESVLLQSLQSIEIILVDDGSSDSSGIICDVLSEQNARVITIHKKNCGLGYARNSGLAIANGKYIAFLDSDDYVESYYYEKMVSEIEKEHAEICIAKGFFRVQDDKKEQVIYLHEYRTVENGNIRDLIPNLISRRLDREDGIWGSACFSIYSQNFLKNNNIYFVSERDFISEDIWFSMDAFWCSTCIVLTDTIGYNYRYNGNSLSRGYRKNRFSQLVSSTKRLRIKCEELNLNDFEERVALYFWGNFEKCINQEVRYGSIINAINNIKIMCEEETSAGILKYLSDQRGFKGLHAILCKLLNAKQFCVCCIILKIYNAIKH